MKLDIPCVQSGSMVQDVLKYPFPFTIGIGAWPCKCKRGTEPSKAFIEHLYLKGTDHPYCDQAFNSRAGHFLVITENLTNTSSSARGIWSSSCSRPQEMPTLHWGCLTVSAWAWSGSSCRWTCAPASGHAGTLCCMAAAQLCDSEVRHPMHCILYWAWVNTQVEAEWHSLAQASAFLDS